MITNTELDRLVQAGIISAGQREQILGFQASQSAGEPTAAKPTIPFFKTLYYLGGFILMFAIVYYVFEAWEMLGHAGRIACATGGLIALGGCGLTLRKSEFRVAGSLLLLAATACVPILIISLVRVVWNLPENTLFGAYSKQNLIPIDLFNGLWLTVDGLTLLISAFLLWKLREAMLVLPVFIFLWLTSFDVYNLATAQVGDQGVYFKCWIGVAVGLLAVWWGIRDHRREGEMTVWSWLFGLLLIVGSLIAMRFEHETAPFKLIYQINVLIYALAVLLAASPLRSKIFLVFGGFGVFWFIQDISWTYFRNSLGFTLVLAISGLVTIGFGILLQRLYTKRFRIEH
jgi:hypothetical protein